MNISYPLSSSISLEKQKAGLLFLFTAAFMYYFYLKNWFPGGEFNLFYALGYGTSVAMGFLIGKQYLLSSFNQKELYPIFRGAIYFLTIYLSILVYSAATDLLIYDGIEFIKIGMLILGVGIFPALAFHFYDQKTKLLFLIKESKQVDETQSIIICVPLRNGIYNLKVEEFIYAESNKNYVDLHLQGGELIKLRTTLKILEQACTAHPELKRIHRAYLINEQYVQEKSQKSVFMKAVNLSLPISTSYQ